jgi:GABA(A) receptor-associated protein
MKRFSETFKDISSIEKRKVLSDKIRSKHTGTVPIIVSADVTCKFTLKRNKYITPENIPMSHLFYTVRKHVNLTETEALFFFIDKDGKMIIPTSSELVGIVHEQYKEDDGFLYITLMKENAFGCGAGLSIVS